MPTPEQSAQIQKHIDDLTEEAYPGGPVRELKERWNALPLHSTVVYLWGIRPDGTLLWMDHEALFYPTEPETRQHQKWAVMVRGAQKYPVLAELIPPAPKGFRVCEECWATGTYISGPDRGEFCLNCMGMGWIDTKPNN